MHNNHVIDKINLDVGCVRSLEQAQAYYLSLVEDWNDPYPAPEVVVHEGVRVVRDDLITGTKVRGADALVSHLHDSIKTLVYVQPRTGLAGVSLLDVAKQHGKEVRLFMPASKRISYHQACVIEQGAQHEFHRIAAMPNLNRLARIWAEEREDAFFIPLGLKHELVTAGLIKVAMQIDAPELVYVATSTGVLTRSLQIAWPKAKFVSICVSRNMKSGELGRAEPLSHPTPFNTPCKADKLPPFPSVPTYDAKVWNYIDKYTAGIVDTLFWNVGSDPILQDETIYDRTESYRDWA